MISEREQLRKIIGDLAKYATSKEIDRILFCDKEITDAYVRIKDMKRNKASYVAGIIKRTQGSKFE